jgi:hypothetical protein
LSITNRSFRDWFQRNPNAGNRIVLIRIPTLNLGRFIESYIDYGAVETFETARLGHGDWGTFIAIFSGMYLADVDIQALPNGKRTTAVGRFGGGVEGVGGGAYTHNRYYASLFYDGASGTCMQGIETGAIVHYIGQYWDNRDSTSNGKDRKVREWTTLDLLFNYTFKLTAPVAPGEVAGYANGGDMAANNGKEKNALPVSTAAYNRGGWRAWLNHTTLTLGVNNVFNLEPPFVAAAPAGNYDQASANPKGRFWYVAVKKRF